MSALSFLFEPFQALGNDTTGSMVVILLGAVLMGAVLTRFVARRKMYLQALYKARVKAAIRPENEAIFKKLQRRLMPLELFVMKNDDYVLIGHARLHTFATDKVVLRIVYYSGNAAVRKGQMCLVHFPPFQAGEERVNSFLGVASVVMPRRITMKSKVHFDFLPRRIHPRYRIKDATKVRAKLWFASPVDGPNTLAMLPPHFEVGIRPGTEMQELNVAAVCTPEDAGCAQVGNISVDGMGIRVPYGYLPDDFQLDERVCLHLYVFDTSVNHYVSLWLAGVIRNIEEDRTQNIYVGIQFTAVAEANEDSRKSVIWDRLGSGEGVESLGPIIEGLNTDREARSAPKD